MSAPKRIFGLGVVFFLVSAGLFCPSWADEGSEARQIEIFSRGKKYDSLEAYQDEQKSAARKVDPSGVRLSRKTYDWLGLQDMYQEAVRRSQHPLGVCYYPAKVKVFVWKNGEPVLLLKKEYEDIASEPPAPGVPDPFGPSYTALKEVGLNAGVARVVEDFVVEGQEGEHKPVNVRNLEAVLRDSVEEKDYDGPLLLMSDQNKLRIMALETQTVDDKGDPQPQTPDQ